MSTGGARWRKAGASNGSGGNNCVEVRVLDPSGDRGWVKAMDCENATCVEVSAVLAGGGQIVSVQVRDSKLGEESPVLSFTADEWRVFLTGARGGEFDLGEAPVSAHG